ncbi:AAA family ATPase [bacterium]|nr:AAA family ATPase [bacterium]
MITKIQSTDIRFSNTKTNLKKHENISNPVFRGREDVLETSFNPQLLKNYYVSFTGKSDSDDLAYSNAGLFTNQMAVELAKSMHHKEAGALHVIFNSIAETIQCIDDLDNGKITLEDIDAESAPAFFASVHDKVLFENPQYRKQVKQVFQKALQYVAYGLNSLPQTKSKAKPTLADSLLTDAIMIKNSGSSESTNEMINAIDILNGAYLSREPFIKSFYNNLNLQLDDIYKLEDKKADRRLYFANYDKYAEKIMKNLNMGTNMFLTYDEAKVEPNNFVPSIIKTLKNSNDKLNSKNTEIVECNGNVDMDYVISKVNSLAKNKDKNYIVVFSQDKLLHNSDGEIVDGIKIVSFTDAYQKVFTSTPKNVRIIAVESKSGYLSRSSAPSLSNVYGNMGEISIPVLNVDDVKKSMLKNKDNDFIKSNNLRYSKKALEKVIDVSTQMEGKFPEKTLRLMSKISQYYIDKKEITPKDVDNYVKNSDYLFRQLNNDGSLEIVFDTGKKLSDIIGKSNTRKDAENIIRQIKSNKMGTKGFVIYSQDGSVGAGRRHTAEVIAGEAKVPFISINTMDFGTKEVDLFGGSAMSPEASIKKLFSTVTTQAESNPHKSAVLYIENFEYFSVGELISEYHQKAMAQLIREMANAEKKGLNIAVIGSVSNPSLIGNATAKSSRFNDEIEVSSPSINYEERYEVLNYASKHTKLKLEGSPEEQDKIIMKYAKYLDGFSFMELKMFMQKAEYVAQERGHKEITLSDMTESFLRMVTGRVNTEPQQQYDKELVTKHEAGHAVNLTVMNYLMKSTNKPWKIPNMVQFITLDPRGYYGGAMFHAKDENSEHNFETLFSNIICSYGGHSAEKYFYDMDGSGGIGCDLQSVSSMSMAMVKRCGLGYNTGKMNVDSLGPITNDIRSKVEKDVNVITRNALLASDLIVEAYSDFINEFADRYSSNVGTGEALVDGDDFRAEFDEWKQRQTPEKQAELKMLDNILLDIISASKKGKLY